MRYLQAIHIIHRLPHHGDRRDRYDIADDGWRVVLTANLPLYERLADFVDRVADDNADAPSRSRAPATCRDSSASSASGCRASWTNGTPSATGVSLNACPNTSPAP